MQTAVLQPKIPSAETMAHAPSASFWSLTIGVIGVVYGDIGTSPIYAFREAMHTVVAEKGIPQLPEVLGILSLIIWTLTVIVMVKYVIVLLRIDNHGEGGTLALMALARGAISRNARLFLFLGMAGAALFYGDSIITPALSVLSAVEGMEVVTPGFERFVLPLTVLIIVGLFLFQSKGTGKVSTLFGPVTGVWFIIIAWMGVTQIRLEPQVLLALNPWYALAFIMKHGTVSLVTLGAVFLAVTGAEALYADLGHFGKKPIQFAWFWFVFPALILNYLGQGAVVLHDPAALENPFFEMAPQVWQMPLVILATFATVIASQAVITGAYSMTQQAVNLGLFPRLEIRHTSDKHSGQIYMPQVNFLMLLGVLFLVLAFKTSSNLATAYGISVTGTMVVTAVMAFFVVWRLWKWTAFAAALLVGPFLIIDGIFLGANMLKVAEGGWMPLTVAAAMILVMSTWLKGTFIIHGRALRRDIKLQKFVRDYPAHYPDLHHAEGTAFFFANDETHVPAALLLNLTHNKVIHDKNVILSVKIEPVPYGAPENRVTVTKLSDTFSVVVLRFGFKEYPDVQAELLKLNRAKDSPISFDWAKTSLFMSRRALRLHPTYGLTGLRGFIYVWLSKHAAEPSDFYKLPVSRVIELGRAVLI